MTVEDTGPIAMVTQQLASHLRSGLTRLSFWVAIALPVFYLPLLVSNLKTTSLLTAYLVLFGIHILALVGGQDYRRPTER